jgi:hypothetical protein
MTSSASPCVRLVWAGRVTTTTSPLRLGWSESEPSTSELLLVHDPLDDLLAGVGRVVTSSNAFRMAVRTCA